MRGHKVGRYVVWRRCLQCLLSSKVSDAAAAAAALPKTRLKVKVAQNEKEKQQISGSVVEVEGIEDGGGRERDESS